MAISKTHLVVPGLAVVAVTGWAAFATVGQAQTSADPPPAATVSDAAADDVHVSAPYTDVNVDKEQGKVRVRAPYTSVKVDPDRGQVRVRAPYVNLDIRW